MYRCARVRGLDSAEGLFLFGRSHFYVVDGFTLMSSGSKGGNSSSTKEIKEICLLPKGSHEPLIPAAKGNSILKRSSVSILLHILYHDVLDKSKFRKKQLFIRYNHFIF